MTKKTIQNSKGNVDNSMSTTSDELVYGWRPNNYRRRIRIKRLSNSAIEKLLSTIPTASQSPHSKIISIKDYFLNVTVQIFKDNIVFIWKQDKVKGVKKWYSISGSSVGDVESKLSVLKAQIIEHLDGAANSFSSLHGVVYLGVPVWLGHEDGLKGDEFLDSLPRDLIIHAENFKKVYADEVEFVGKTNSDPTAKVVRYINNRVVERFAPEIAREINLVALFSVDIVSWCEASIRCVEDVFLYEDILRHLPRSKRLDVSNFLFDKFGGFA